MPIVLPGRAGKMPTKLDTVIALLLVTLTAPVTPALLAPAWMPTDPFGSPSGFSFEADVLPVDVFAVTVRDAPVPVVMLTAPEAVWPKMPMLLSPATAMLLLAPVLTRTFPDAVVAAMPILFAPVVTLPDASAVTVMAAPADALSRPVTVTLPLTVEALMP